MRRIGDENKSRGTRDRRWDVCVETKEKREGSVMAVGVKTKAGEAQEPSAGTCVMKTKGNNEMGVRRIGGDNKGRETTGTVGWDVCVETTEKYERCEWDVKPT